MLKFKSLAVAAAALAVSSLSNAATVDLGAVSTAVPTTFQGLVANGAFADTFTFTLPANSGSGYSVANFGLLEPLGFKTAFSSLSLWSDADGIAWNGNESLLATSVAAGGKASLSYGATGAGHYLLSVVGAGVGAQGGAYSGSISVAAPVPEPETYAMMLAGLGALGFLASRRRG